MPTLEEFNLDGKVAIVTGAAQGIGKGIAIALAKAGADLILGGIALGDRDNDEVAMESVAKEIRALGRTAIPVVADVRVSEDIDKLPHNRDLVILKDVLQHWTNDNITQFMDILVTQGHKNILLINGYKEAKGKDRCINNRYKYAKLDCNQEPLKKYKPTVLFTYRFKQVAIIN